MFRCLLIQFVLKCVFVILYVYTCARVGLIALSAQLLLGVAVLSHLLSLFEDQSFNFGFVSLSFN
jgi:hypothetical protein